MERTVDVELKVADTAGRAGAGGAGGGRHRRYRESSKERTSLELATSSYSV
jgi:hypothetical protein